MFEDVVGHQNQIKLLSSALSKGKLAHAYVFAGPDGVGKRLIAKSIANALLEVSGDRFQGTGFHPDFLKIDGTEGIKIEQIRELVYKLSLKPYQAKYKVALIDKADAMTVEAANALLKILEEPKDYNHIFLITSNPNRLPKTVLSRCQKITFGPMDLPGEKTEESSSEVFFTSFMTESLSQRLISAYELADLETDEIKTTLDLWLKKLQKNLHHEPSKNLANKISQVMLARKFLDQNANCKLLLTNLMLNTA